jgi:hypothetical protein
MLIREWGNQLCVSDTPVLGKPLCLRIALHHLLTAPLCDSWHERVLTKEDCFFFSGDRFLLMGSRHFTTVLTRIYRCHILLRTVISNLFTSITEAKGTKAFLSRLIPRFLSSFIFFSFLSDRHRKPYATLSSLHQILCLYSQRCFFIGRYALKSFVCLHKE